MTTRRSRRGRLAATLLVAAALLGAAAAASQAGESAVGTVGAPSLSIPVGPRLTASPDVIAGMDPDASVVFSNPAFLSGIDAPEFFLSTSNWLDDLRQTAVGAVWPLGEHGPTLSFGSMLLHSGNLNGYDSSLNVVSQDSYYDAAFKGAIGYRFESLGLSVGAGGTYLRQHVQPSDGNGYAFDVGASWAVGGNFLQAAARNIGGAVSFDGVRYDVDSQAMFGLGRTIEFADGFVHAGAQVVTSTVSATRVELGLDYGINRFVVVRTSLMDLSGEVREAPGFGAGLGIRYQGLALEYAFTPRQYFSDTHTFAITFSLAGHGLGTPAGAGKGTLAPAGDAAPVVSGSQIQGRPTANRGQAKPHEAKGTRYLVVSGTHGRAESAEADVRSLHLLGIPAHVEPMGTRLCVVVGEFASRAAAESAVRRYSDHGARLNILVLPAAGSGK